MRLVLSCFGLFTYVVQGSSGSSLMEVELIFAPDLITDCLCVTLISQPCVRSQDLCTVSYEDMHKPSARNSPDVLCALSYLAKRLAVDLHYHKT